MIVFAALILKGSVRTKSFCIADMIFLVPCGSGQANHTIQHSPQINIHDTAGMAYTRTKTPTADG